MKKSEIKKLIKEEIIKEMARPQGDKYSIKFETRKSNGSHDRKMLINRENLVWSKIKNVVNQFNSLGLGGNGWYIRGNVHIHNENTGEDKYVKPSLIQASKKYDDI